MKLLALIRHGTIGSAGLTEAARALSSQPAVDRCVLDVCEDAAQAQAAGYIGMLELWGRDLRADLLNKLAPSAEVYAVDELIEKAPPSGLFQGIKLVAPWTLKPGLDAVEGRRHWDEHVPLALSVHLGACAYVRHWVRAVLAPQILSYQGIATLWFSTESDLRERLFAQPGDQRRIAQDVDEFIGRNCAFATRERQFHKGQVRFAVSAI